MYDLRQGLLHKNTMVARERSFRKRMSFVLMSKTKTTKVVGSIDVAKFFLHKETNLSHTN